MASTLVDLETEQGSDLRYSIVYKESNGTAVNITGASAKMQVRKWGSETTAAIQLDASNGLSLGTTNGVVAIAIPGAATAKLPAGTYRYDLILTTSAGVVDNIMYGKFIVSQGVTR
jgi:hypothetical protein